jgi:hypothetical protein
MREMFIRKPITLGLVALNLNKVLRRKNEITGSD